MIFNELRKSYKKDLERIVFSLYICNKKINQLKIYIMKTIDTRDLIEERDNLKEQILDNFNDRFNTELNDFDEIETYASENIDDFKSYLEDEYQQINNIDEVENTIGSEFTYGCTLIEEDDFVEYVEEMLIDCGYISKDSPTWIEIDWETTAGNVKQYYSELEYKGDTYYFRD